MDISKVLSRSDEIRLPFAEKLLNKITNKEERLKLINMKNNKNESILDYFESRNITNMIQWIQKQIADCQINEE